MRRSYFSFDFDLDPKIYVPAGPACPWLSPTCSAAGVLRTLATEKEQMKKYNRIN